MANTAARFDTVKSELEKLSPQELLNELVHWRLAASAIQKMTNQLSEFKQYANNADELAEKIRALSARYDALIQFREEQMKELMAMFEQIQKDPVGASQHIETMVQSGLKRKLN